MNQSGEKAVLVVDDQPAERDMICRCFFKLKPTPNVITAINGQAAMGLLESAIKIGQCFDLILMDLNMPLFGGFDFLVKVKRHEVYRRIPIVIFSSSDHEMEVRKAYQDGANGYVKKPFGLAALEQEIERIASFWLHANRFQI